MPKEEVHVGRGVLWLRSPLPEAMISLNFADGCTRMAATAACDNQPFNTVAKKR